MYRGAEAEAQRTAELQRQQHRREQAWMPFRLWLPVGTQGRIIILDNDLGPCFFEHNLQDPATGKRTIWEFCPKDYGHCPLCQRFGESYYVMFLSVLDIRSYTNRQGQTVPWSRKLMAVKAQQQSFYARLHESQDGLRGVHLRLFRDAQMSPAIGAPELHCKHTEQDIIDFAGGPAQTSTDGKVLKPANADCYPYNYDELFHRPDPDDLMRRYGGTPPVGSTMEHQAVWGSQPPPQPQQAAPAQPAAQTQPAVPAAQAQPAQPAQGGAIAATLAQPPDAPPPAQPAGPTAAVPPVQGGGIAQSIQGAGPADPLPEDRIPY